MNYYPNRQTMVGELGYSFLFRDYAPAMGKWTTPDPLGCPDGLYLTPVSGSVSISQQWNMLLFNVNDIVDAIVVYIIQQQIGYRTFAVTYLQEAAIPH